jgi:hypothetical protein
MDNVQNYDIYGNMVVDMATAWCQARCSLLVWRFYFVPVRNESLVYVRMWKHCLPSLCWTRKSSFIRANKLYCPSKVMRLERLEYRGPFCSYDFHKLNTCGSIWKELCLWNEFVIFLLLSLFIDVSQPFELLFPLTVILTLFLPSCFADPRSKKLQRRGLFSYTWREYRCLFFM